MSNVANPAAESSGDVRDDRLGPLEIVMRKMAEEPTHRNAGMSIWILDQAPDWDRFVNSWDRASRLVPRMRQRLVDPALGIGTPVWVTDPHFDLHFHVRRVRAPEPGTFRQLLDLARPVLMAPSDPARPPWETLVVEGLEGGRAAVLQKGDHTVVDGQGGMKMMEIICDLQREVGPEEPMPSAPQPSDVSSTTLLRADISDRFRAAPRSGLHGVERIAGLALELIRHPRRTATNAAELAASIGRVFGAMRTPKSPLFAGRSLSHRYDVLEITLADLRRAGKTIGGSLNDAFLTGLLGGIRIYHDKHGVPIDILGMGFTVSNRRPEDPMESNRFSDVVIAAPVGVADARERMQRVREQVLAMRAEPALAVTESLIPVMSMLPTPLLTSVFAGAGGDVNASNLPGPPIPLYMAGAQIERLFGFGPLAGCAMLVGLISVMGQCCIGINSDPAAVPDPDLLIECLREGFEEVLNLVDDHEGVRIPTFAKETTSEDEAGPSA